MTKKNENIENEYWEVIELTDPITNKKFTQKVKITKYKTPNAKGKGVAEELEDDPVVITLDEDFEADQE
jgi:hypothetical protein